MLIAVALIVLGLVSGKAADHTCRRRLAEVGRSRMPAEPERASIRR